MTSTGDPMRIDIGTESLFLMQWYREHGDSELWRRASRCLEELATYRAREARPPAPPAIEGQLGFSVETAQPTAPEPPSPELLGWQYAVEKSTIVRAEGQVPPGQRIRTEHRVTWAGALHDTIIAAEKTCRVTGIPQVIRQPGPEGWVTTHTVQAGEYHAISGFYDVLTVAADRAVLAPQEGE